METIDPAGRVQGEELPVIGHRVGTTPAVRLTDEFYTASDKVFVFIQSNFFVLP
jgi:hypothetical protein